MRPDVLFFLQWLGPKSMQKPPWCRNPSGNRRSCANVVCVCFGKACCGLLLRGSCWACCGEVGLWIAKRFAWQTAKCRFSFCWLFKTSSTLESATIMRVIKMKWSWPDWKDTWSPPFASCLRLEAYQVRLFSCDESCQKRDPSAEVSWRSRDVEAKLWIFGRVWKCATMIPSFFFHKYHTNPHGCSEFQQSTPAQETCLESAVSSSWQGLRADMVPWVAVRLKHLSDG